MINIEDTCPECGYDFVDCVCAPYEDWDEFDLGEINEKEIEEAETQGNAIIVPPPSEN
jgi:hypothetical protein